jgi:hypothetical protein
VLGDRARGRISAGRPRRRPERRTARAIATFGLAIAAAGITVSAIFATQTVAGVLPEGVARTTTGQLHDFGTLAEWRLAVELSGRR